MRRALTTVVCTVAVAVSGACTRSTPGADSAAAPAAIDSTVDRPAPPSPAPTNPAPSTPAPPPPAPPPDTTPARPRLTPRPPRPVPLPMPPGEGGGAIPSAGADRETLDRLRAEVRALAKAEGCTAADQCRALPIGARPCGGPETYVVYCPRATDVAALERKAAELERVQKAYNAKQGLMSTCEYRMPPTVVHVGGSCRAAAASGVPDVPAVRVP